MRSFNLYKVITLFSLLCMIGCKDNTSFLNDGNSYSWLKSNGERVYRVEEKVYTVAGTVPQESVFFEKHTIVSLESYQNSVTAKIMVYKADNLNSKWIESDYYLIEEKIDEVVETRNNKSKVILKLPIKKSMKWNENIYNQSDDTLISYDNLGALFSYNEREWDNTVKVAEVMEKSTLIDYINKYKIYAPTIGLVYEENVSLEYCQESDCLGQYKIVSGYSYKKVVIE